MTGHTDWRAQRDATKSQSWLAGRDEFTPGEPIPYHESAEYLGGWYRAMDDYDEARDRAREDRQHYPASPLSALERNRP